MLNPDDNVNTNQATQFIAIKVETPLQQKTPEIFDSLLYKAKFASSNHDRHEAIIKLFSLEKTAEQKEQLALLLAESAIKDGAILVRETAVSILGKLHVYTSEVVEALFKAILEQSNKDSTKRVGNPAAESLINIGINMDDPSELVKSLQKILTDNAKNNLGFYYYSEKYVPIFDCLKEIFEVKEISPTVCDQLSQLLLQGIELRIKDKSRIHASVCSGMIAIFAVIKDFEFTKEERELLIKLINDKADSVSKTTNNVLNAFVNYTSNFDAIKQHIKLGTLNLNLDLNLNNFMQLTKDNISNIIFYYKNLYQGNYESRASDAALLRKAISRILKINYIKFLKLESEFKYLALLTDKAGVIADKAKDENEKEYPNQINLEGIFLDKFLPLRIRFLFELLIQIEKGDIVETKLPANKKTILDLLNQELLTLLELYNTYKDVWFIESIPVNSILNGTPQEELIKILAERVAERISNLSEDKEYSFYSGYSDDKAAHALYVNFTRKGELIFIRVDNLGDAPDYHNYGEKDRKEQRQPYSIGFLAREKFVNKDRIVIDYLINLARAIKNKRTEAFEFIYDCKSSLEANKIDNNNTFELHWKKVQKVGNCSVKNLNAGMLARLILPGKHEKERRRLYSWTRLEEKKYAVTSKKSYVFYKGAFFKQGQTQINTVNIDQGIEHQVRNNNNTMY